jgi:hypothetical protein
MSSLFYRVLLAAILTIVFVYPACAEEQNAPWKFKDVPLSHWAYDDIKTAVKAGILKGYNGVFKGDQLLDRFQIAVIAENLLNTTGSAKFNTLSKEKALEILIGLKALVVEYFNELKMVESNMSKLESNIKKLDILLAKLQEEEEIANQTSNLIVTTYASFGLVKGQSGITWEDGTPIALPEANNDSFNSVRYSGNTAPQFVLPQISIGLDRKITKSFAFHGQFDWDSDTNSLQDSESIVNEAFITYRKSANNLQLKAGMFALPFSMEHNGAFRTCSYTITPSPLNTGLETYRPYGLEFSSSTEFDNNSIEWKFGIVSGTDHSFPLTFHLTDKTRSENSFEGDGDPGFYFRFSQTLKEEKITWNAGYFNNGSRDTPLFADASEYASTGWNYELNFLHGGLSYDRNKFHFQSQFLMGNFHINTFGDGPPPNETDSNISIATYLLSYKVNHKHSCTLRYDSFSSDLGNNSAYFASLNPMDALFEESALSDGTALTFCWNYYLSSRSMMQLEYIMPDRELPDSTISDFYGPSSQKWKANSDLIQLRYKMLF